MSIMSAPVVVFVSRTASVSVPGLPGSRLAQQSSCDPHISAEPAQMGDEVVGGGAERVVGERLAGVEDEQGGRRAVGELSALGLSPVPAAAGDAGIITPDDFTWVRVLDDGQAARRRVERLLTGGADQPRQARVAVEVLAAERYLVQHGHG